MNGINDDRLTWATFKATEGEEFTEEEIELAEKKLAKGIEAMVNKYFGRGK